MGIKTSLNHLQLPKAYQAYPLIATKNGVSDSVYLLGECYVLKHFETTTIEEIENEKKLLTHLKTLCVPQVVEQFQINGKEVVIFTQVEGESPLEPTDKQVAQIGTFLKAMHLKTKGMKSSNKQLYELKNVQNMVDKLHYQPLKKHFSTLKITLKNDGIIHGDLFIDNAKFKEGKITGVYDFTEACEGDFLFDLAVVALSWCFEGVELHEKKLETLMKSYDETLNKATLMPYLKYALLYYTTTRYTHGRNYATLLKKYEGLLATIRPRW